MDSKYYKSYSIAKSAYSLYGIANDLLQSTNFPNIGSHTYNSHSYALIPTWLKLFLIGLYTQLMCTVNQACIESMNA